MKSSGFATTGVTKSLEVSSYNLILSIEETLLNMLSKEWDTAFDRSLEAALGIWKAQFHPHLKTEGGG